MAQAAPGGTLKAGQSSGQPATARRSNIVVDAVIVFAIAVIVINLAFVVVPARELRTLLAPPRRQAPAPPERVPDAAPGRRAAGSPPTSSPVEPASSRPARPVAPSPRDRRQAIVLRSAPAIGGVAAIGGD